MHSYMVYTFVHLFFLHLSVFFNIFGALYSTPVINFAVCNPKSNEVAKNRDPPDPDPARPKVNKRVCLQTKRQRVVLGFV